VRNVFVVSLLIDNSLKETVKGKGRKEWLPIDGWIWLLLDFRGKMIFHKLRLITIYIRFWNNYNKNGFINSGTIFTNKGGNRISAITIGIICEEYNKGENTWQLLNEMAMCKNYKYKNVTEIVNDNLWQCQKFSDYI
jgi:hypothetical protein